MSKSSVTAWVRPAAAIAGLWAVAVAQPVFDLLSQAPEFFVAHHASRLDMVAFTLTSAWAPPLAAGLLLVLASLIGRRVANLLASVLIGALAALLAVQFSYRLGVTNWTAAAFVLAVSTVLAAWAWLKVRPFQVAVTVVAAAALAVPALFLFSGGVRAVMRGSATVLPPRVASQLPPVVVVVFDELPLASLLDGNGRLDPLRYPNLAALAADGVWFSQATTVSDYTRWALPAILSGNYPKARSVPTPADHPNTLFTLLASSHRMTVQEPLTALCPAALSGKMPDPVRVRAARVVADVTIVAQHLLWPPEARAGLPSISQGWSGFAGRDDGFQRMWREGKRADHLADALEFIDGITRSDVQPALYLMHSMVTHHPPRWLSTGQRYDPYVPPPDVMRGRNWITTEWPVIQRQQAHLVQAGLADLLIGRLRARLREAGLYERAVVVITADHGVSFLPGESRRDYTTTNVGEVLPVPLIVKMSAGRQLLPAGSVSGRNVESIDILPTIADAAGVTLPWQVDGVSAFAAGRERPDKRIYFRSGTRMDSHQPSDVARSNGAAVARKVRLFGTGVWPSPAPAGLEALIGRPVASLPVEEAAARVHVTLDATRALYGVRLDGPTLPADVTGRVTVARGRSLAAVHLALALNGTVVAATRTWARTGEWRALLPPSTFREGRNDLDVFVVDPAAPLRLHRAAVHRALPPETDLLFDGVAAATLERHGFHRAERSGTTAFRWTDGAASIRIPVEPLAPLTRLTVGALTAVAPGTKLRVLLDDCELASDMLPDGPWSRSIDMTRCASAGPFATLRFLSEARRPGGKDNRRLGVALTQVVLH